MEDSSQRMVASHLRKSAGVMSNGPQPEDAVPAARLVSAKVVMLQTTVHS